MIFLKFNTKATKKLMRNILFFFLLIISNVKGQIINNFYTESALNFNYDTIIKHLPSEIKILALGESTHGSQDIVKLKTELLKSLILNGYKNIILESNFSTTLLLNKFIKNESDEDLKTILINIGFFPYFDDNFVSFIKWLKQYNSQKSATEMVNIYGMDVQFELDQAIELKEKLFSKYDSLPLIKIEQIIHNKYSPFKKTFLLKKIISANANGIYNLNRLDSLVLLNLIESHLRLFQPKGKRYKQREELMYINIERFINLFIPPSEKLVIWSHNGHLEKRSNVRKITGEYLYKKYGNKYYSIGIDINKGRIKAINKDSIINKLFLSNFELDTNKSIGKELELINMGILYMNNLDSENFFKTNSCMRDIGGTYSYILARNYPNFYYVNTKVYKKFDALFIINNSNPLNIENFGYK